MTRDETLERVLALLRRAGWEHAYPVSGCFDVLARGDEESLVLKIHENVDTADRATAEEMKQACRFLGATPLIVGEKTSRGELEPRVLYERYDVPTVAPDTLRDYLALREPPRIKHTRGGRYAKLDTAKLEAKRREQDYSLNALAREVGVSARTIRTYRDRGTAAVEQAHRLEDVLGPVTEGIALHDIEIRVSTTTSNRVSERLVRIGFDAAGFSSAPFDAAARDGAGSGDADAYVAKEARDLSDALLRFLERLPDMADSRTFLVTEREEAYGDLPAVSESRLDEMDDTADLKDEVR